MSLIKNSEDLKANSESNYAFNYASVKMSIIAAERKYIVPIIGTAQYNALNTAYLANTLTAEQSALLAMIQPALAALALAIFAPIGDVTWGDAGLRRTGTEQNPGAFKYQLENFIEAQQSRGLDFLEDLITFLEANASDYPLWTASDEFAEYRSLFIRNGSDFASVYTAARHPRQLYLRLRSALWHVQENIIRPTILDGTYEELLGKLATNPIGYTGNDKILIKHLQRAMAYLALKEGLSDYSLNIDSHGVTILNDKNDSSQNSISKKTAASDLQLSSLASTAHNTGHTWLQRAVDFLTEHAAEDEYEDWYNKLEAQDGTENDDINESLDGSFSL